MGWFGINTKNSIFAPLITYVHSPTYSFSKIKLSEGADFPVMGISHKHAPEGSPLVMELILHSRVYGTHTVYYDDEDHLLVSHITWHIAASRGVFYARTGAAHNKIAMHTLIMGAKGVDHISGNGLDNRKLNLRIGTQGQNMCNKKAQRNSKTGFKGVIQRKDGQFAVEIQAARVKFYGGLFTNKYEAALEANRLILLHHGEFARPNILSDLEIELSKVKIPLPPMSNNKSGYRGVFLTKSLKWKAAIEVKGKSHNLGLYGSKVEAARAYNEAIVKFGMSVKHLNVIPD